VNPDQKQPNRLLLFNVALLAGFAGLSAPAATLYVDANNAAPGPPYSTWATAATNIQDAVDVAVAGDEIAVTNGVYQSGQRVWPPGEWTNRLAVTKPLKLYSVNGSGVTIIDAGGQIRCVYLVADATLSGFTLSNGIAGYLGYRLPTATKGGGLYCESNSVAVSDCVITRNKVGYYTGPTIGALGAGVYGGTLTRCTLTLNTTALSDGGGAAYAILNNCVISSNRADSGGGALHCTLNNCSILNNGAYYGGGAADSTLNNCTIANNWAATGEGGIGGGTLRCTANNCVLSNNVALGEPDPHFYAFGGGAWGGTLNNCTITGNYSWHGAGGASGATLNNCIVYYNTAHDVDPDCSTNCTLNYCCTTFMPISGMGNFTNQPLFGFGSLRLQAGSPCINAGNNAYVTSSTDLDGNPRISGGTVDVGAYEFVFARQLFFSKLSGTKYCFSFDSETNRTYVVEYKNALTDPDWNSYPPVIGNGQMFTVTNSVGDIPQRFYRLRVE
jgi:hypothetical protein